MNSARWQQIDELFDAALELPEPEREKFLSERTGGDDELRREVNSLLEAQKKAESFMEVSAMRVAAQNLAEAETIVVETLPANWSIGTYRVEKLLGAGGMGEVYLARDEKLNRKVALKILPAEFVADPERVKRFEREARMISALNHPYIVTIYDVGSAGGVNYIATEYVEGQTVRELLKDGIDIKKTLSIVSQICEALAAAHQAEIVHRDIKPENIMIRPDGYVKVLDFGLAKLSETSELQNSISNYTMKGVIIGTPSYMSPAQVTDDKIDHRTDLWSVGVVLYEMLTGKNPFRRENRQTTFRAILSENPANISEFNSQIPSELDGILNRVLEKDADLNYQTASDLRADLKRVRREMDSSASLQSVAVEHAAASRKKNRKFLSWASAALALVFIGLGIWFFFGRNTTAMDATDWSKATNIQLTDQPQTEFFPSLAPDGKSFVYASEGDGDFDIYWQRIGGKNPVNLTKDSIASDTQPVFSPDGERIAFRSDREPKGIYIMEATGENPRRISDFGYHPSWSPNGKEIVVSTEERDMPNVRNNTTSSLWILTIETGAKRMLIEMDAMQPSWSPDGSRIAFWFMQPGGSKRDVATVAASGGEAVIVSKDGATNWNPVWSPDGNFLYYVSDRSGNMSFWRTAIDQKSGSVTGEPEAVGTPSKYSRHLAFSRDGKRLIYVQSEFKSNIQAVGFDAKTEKIVGEPFWITSGDRQVSRPELSPDGKQFVSRLPRRTQDDIALIDRETGEIRDLTNDAAFDRYPRWSPDGKEIAFISDRSGSHEIWTIDPQGTNLKQITFNNSKGVAFPHWSPVEHKMLFRLNQQNFLFSLDKNWNEQKPVALPEPPENTKFTVWDWSPDGRFLLGTFSDGWRGLGFYSFAANRYEKISNIEEIPSWLPDNRRLVYASQGKAFVTDIDTKKERQISLPQPDPISTVSVSRDNSLLYFTVISKESDIWLLDATPQSR